MKCKEANIHLKEIIEKHLIALQSGEFGKPTIKDLNFCGILHGAIERFHKIYKE